MKRLTESTLRGSFENLGEPKVIKIVWGPSPSLWLDTHETDTKHDACAQQTGDRRMPDCETNSAVMLDEGRLRDVIESRTVTVGDEEYRLRLVGFSETPNNAVLIAIAIGGIDERLQLQLSDDLRRDPLALRQRVVYFAKRIVTNTRPHASAP